MGWLTKEEPLADTVGEALAPMANVVKNLHHVVKVMVEKAKDAKREAAALRRQAEWKDTNAKNAVAESARAERVVGKLTELLEL